MHVSHSKGKELRVLPNSIIQLAEQAEHLGCIISLGRGHDIDTRIASVPRVILHKEIINTSPCTIWVKQRDGLITSHPPCDYKVEVKNIVRIISGYSAPQEKTLEVKHESDCLLGDMLDSVSCPTRDIAKQRADLCDETNKQLRRRGSSPEYRYVIGSPYERDLRYAHLSIKVRGLLEDYKLDNMNKKIMVDYDIENFTGSAGKYVPELDVVIATSEQSIMATLHPFSATGLRMKEAIYGNNISTNIYIVDNEDKFHKRYTTVCGVTIEVPIVKDPSAKNGFYFKYYRTSKKDPTIVEQEVITYSVEEADSLGIIRSKREEFKIELADRAKLEEIESRQKQVQLAEEKLQIERERFEQEKLDKQNTRKDNWVNGRIKDVLDTAKIILPILVTLLGLYLKMKKS